MRSDARHILNKKKWSNASGNAKKEPWRNQKSITHGRVDARSILESKRAVKNTKSNTGFIHLAKKELSQILQKPGKQVQLARDGNIWVTSQNAEKKKLPYAIEITVSSKNKQPQLTSSSAAVDDLEHTSINDIMDMESLPPALVTPPAETKSVPSRTSLANQVLAMRNTMVADQEMLPEQNVKVYVTNLHSSVSKQDVVELFGDVGLIKSAEVLQPGAAAIEYYNAEDAKNACDIYHNRLLDGQPMQCYVKQDVRPQRVSISERLGGKIISQPSFGDRTPSSLPSSSRSRYNPRNVQFTVKL